MGIRQMYRGGITITELAEIAPPDEWSEWPIRCPGCTKRVATHRVVYSTGIDDDIADLCPPCILHDFGEEV